MSSPRVVQSASWQSASWRIRELSSYQLGLGFSRVSRVSKVRVGIRISVRIRVSFSNRVGIGLPNVE